MCHVLVIEDDPWIAEIIGDLACEAGASSLAFAATENAAVECARFRKPDVILSDVRLAHGTGPQAVSTITEDLGLIPVIFITGTPYDCETLRPRPAVVTKPFRAIDVIDAFRQVAPSAAGSA